LEAYNMDPGTFNEEASFIGQYSSPSRNSGYREHHTAI
uniref:Movement protein BC1 n=1 Tax=Rodentolepis nana TaxID=102285 RepID=A0A0R3TZB3_RODNA